jgi:uncharacterized protein YjbI with pentapeptide repeats
VAIKMQNEDRNFKGQDLRGQSFKGQDLTGADFSDCDLRGVDFSFANLTDAKFCNARMGRSKITDFGIVFLLFNLLLLILLGISLIDFCLYILFYYSVKSIGMYELIGKTSYDFLYLAITSFFITIATKIINNNLLNGLWYFWITQLLIICIADESKMIASLALTFAAIFISLKYLKKHEALVIVIIPATIIMIFLIIIGVQKIFSDVAEFLSTITSENFFITILPTTAIWMIFFIRLQNISIKKEDSQLSWLRNVFLKISCLGGTEFSSTILNYVDFEASDLKYARFKNAQITNCNFQNARNHHLALTENTPLEPRKVRYLVIDHLTLFIDGKITDKNFSTLDLRGLDFSNLNLQGFDFSHSNLSGANLSHTQMTGAILEGWSIDTETRLDDIECSYYYYLDNGEKKRMPPEGEAYKAGEFTRIFQKIANTIDFIAHNEMELAAIKYSVEQVQVETGNNEIRVQGIEEKDGVIVVKVAVPKFEDRGVLYHELKQKITQVQLRLRDKTHRIKELKSEIDDLKNKIKEKRQNLTVIIENSNINNDGIMLIASDTNGNISQQNNL